MKTILFLHGFFASGSCVPALALQSTFGDTYRVLTPDLPMHPERALEYIRQLCLKEKPDVIVGNSCGSFYGQIIANELSIPALLGNPYFVMTEFLQPRKGPHQYKSPRKDGNQDFVIDDNLISEFAAVQERLFDNLRHTMREQIWGLFGEKDTLAHFEPMFREHYPTVFHFPGAHTPTANEIEEYYAPLVERLLFTSC